MRASIVPAALVLMMAYACGDKLAAENAAVFDVATTPVQGVVAGVDVTPGAGAARIDGDRVVVSLFDEDVDDPCAASDANVVARIVAAEGARDIPLLGAASLQFFDEGRLAPGFVQGRLLLDPVSESRLAGAVYAVAHDEGKPSEIDGAFEVPLCP